MSKTYIKPIYTHQTQDEFDWNSVEDGEITVLNSGDSAFIKFPDSGLTLVTPEVNNYFDPNISTVQFGDQIFNVPNANNVLKGISSAGDVIASLDKYSASHKEVITLNIDRLTRGDIDDVLNFNFYVLKDNGAFQFIKTFIGQSTTFLMDEVSSMIVGVSLIDKNTLKESPIFELPPIRLKFFNKPLTSNGFLSTDRMNERTELDVRFDLSKITNNVSPYSDLTLLMYIPKGVAYDDPVGDLSTNRKININENIYDSEYNVYSGKLTDNIVFKYGRVLGDEDFIVHIALIDPLHESYGDPESFQYVTHTFKVVDTSQPPNLSRMNKFFSGVINEGFDGSFGKNQTLDYMLRDETGGTNFLQYKYVFDSRIHYTGDQITGFNSKVHLKVPQIEGADEIDTDVEIIVNDTYTGLENRKTLPLKISPAVVLPSENVSIELSDYENDNYMACTVAEYTMTSTGDIFDSGTGRLRLSVSSLNSRISVNGGDLNSDELFPPDHTSITFDADNLPFSRKVHAKFPCVSGNFSIKIFAKDSTQDNFVELYESDILNIVEYQPIDVSDIEISFLSDELADYNGDWSNPIVLDNFTHESGVYRESYINVVELRNIRGGSHPITAHSNLLFTNTVFQVKNDLSAEVSPEGTVRFEIHDVDVRDITERDEFDADIYRFKDKVSFRFTDALDTNGVEWSKDIFFVKSVVLRPESSIYNRDLGIVINTSVDHILNEVGINNITLDVSDPDIDRSIPYKFRVSLWSDADQQDLDGISIVGNGKEVDINSGDYLEYDSSENALNVSCRVNSVYPMPKGISHKIYFSVYTLSERSISHHAVITFTALEYRSTDSRLDTSRSKITLTNPVFDNESWGWINYKRNYIYKISGVIDNDTNLDIDYDRALIRVYSDFHDRYPDLDPNDLTIRHQGGDTFECNLDIRNPAVDYPFTIKIEIRYDGFTVNIHKYVVYKVFDLFDLINYDIRNTEGQIINVVDVPDKNDPNVTLMINDTIKNDDLIGYSKYLDDLVLEFRTNKDYQDGNILTYNNFSKNTGNLIPSLNPRKHIFNLWVNRDRPYYNASVSWVVAATNIVTHDIESKSVDNAFTLSPNSDIDFNGAYLEVITTSLISSHSGETIYHNKDENLILQVKGLRSKTNDSNFRVRTDGISFSMNIPNPYNLTINDGISKFELDFQFGSIRMFSDDSYSDILYLNEPTVTFIDQNSISTTHKFNYFKWNDVDFSVVEVKETPFLYMNQLVIEDESGVINKKSSVGRYVGKFTIPTSNSGYRYDLNDLTDFIDIYYEKIIIEFGLPKSTPANDPTDETNFTPENDTNNSVLNTYRFEINVSSFNRRGNDWYNDVFRLNRVFLLNEDRVLSMFDSKINTIYFNCKVTMIKRSGVEFVSYPYSGLRYDIGSMRADIIKPTISMIGESIVEIDQYETYNDKGATASDNKDGDITHNIVTNSTVNTDVPGSYRVTYNVTDSSGNAANEVSREVNVNHVDLINVKSPLTYTIHEHPVPVKPIYNNTVIYNTLDNITGEHTVSFDGVVSDRPYKYIIYEGYLNNSRLSDTIVNTIIRSGASSHTSPNEALFIKTGLADNTGNHPTYSFKIRLVYYNDLSKTSSPLTLVYQPTPVTIDGNILTDKIYIFPEYKVYHAVEDYFHYFYELSKHVHLHHTHIQCACNFYNASIREIAAESKSVFNVQDLDESTKNGFLRDLNSMSSHLKYSTQWDSNAGRYGLIDDELLDVNYFINMTFGYDMNNIQGSDDFILNINTSGVSPISGYLMFSMSITNNNTITLSNNSGGSATFNLPISIKGDIVSIIVYRLSNKNSCNLILESLNTGNHYTFESGEDFFDFSYVTQRSDVKEVIWINKDVVSLFGFNVLRYASTKPDVDYTMLRPILGVSEYMLHLKNNTNRRLLLSTEYSPSNNTANEFIQVEDIHIDVEGKGSSSSINLDESIPVTAKPYYDLMINGKNEEVSDRYELECSVDFIKRSTKDIKQNILYVDKLHKPIDIDLDFNLNKIGSDVFYAGSNNTMTQYYQITDIKFNADSGYEFNVTIVDEKGVVFVDPSVTGNNDERIDFVDDDKSFTVEKVIEVSIEMYDPNRPYISKIKIFYITIKPFTFPITSFKEVGVKIIANDKYSSNTTLYDSRFNTDDNVMIDRDAAKRITYSEGLDIEVNIDNIKNLGLDKYFSGMNILVGSASKTPESIPLHNGMFSPMSMSELIDIDSISNIHTHNVYIEDDTDVPYGVNQEFNIFFVLFSSIDLNHFAYYRFGTFNNDRFFITPKIENIIRKVDITTIPVGDVFSGTSKFVAYSNKHTLGERGYVHFDANRLPSNYPNANTPNPTLIVTKFKWDYSLYDLINVKISDNGKPLSVGGNLPYEPTFSRDTSDGYTEVVISSAYYLNTRRETKDTKLILQFRSAGAGVGATVTDIEYDLTFTSYYNYLYNTFNYSNINSTDMLQYGYSDSPFTFKYDDGSDFKEYFIGSDNTLVSGGTQQFNENKLYLVLNPDFFYEYELRKFWIVPDNFISVDVIECDVAYSLYNNNNDNGNNIFNGIHTDVDFSQNNKTLPEPIYFDFFGASDNDDKTIRFCLSVRVRQHNLAPTTLYSKYVEFPIRYTEK